MINPAMLGGGPPQGQMPPGQPQGGQPTIQLRAAIQALHDAIAHEPEPGDKVALSAALQVILKVQAKNMTEQGGGGGAGQALAGQLGAGPPGRMLG